MVCFKSCHSTNQLADPPPHFWLTEHGPYSARPGPDIPIPGGFTMVYTCHLPHLCLHPPCEPGTLAPFPTAICRASQLEMSGLRVLGTPSEVPGGLPRPGEAALSLRTSQDLSLPSLGAGGGDWRQTLAALPGHRQDPRSAGSESPRPRAPKS